MISRSGRMAGIAALVTILAVFAAPCFSQDQSASGGESSGSAAGESPAAAGQDASASAAHNVRRHSTDRGFGLQAAVFARVSNGRTDLNRDFASLERYPLTPGDVFTLTIWYGYSSSGNQPASNSFNVQLREDYTLNLPIVGIINVRDSSVLEIEDNVSEQIQNIIPAQFVSLRLAQPAQFNVFVYGNVNAPGNIAATPMTSVVDALTAAGGFKAGASYRNIRLERDGGDLRIDLSASYSSPNEGPVPTLRPGDRIFVPFADVVADIGGKVLYPGRYELRSEDTLASLVSLAGGVTAGALTDRIEVRRINTRGGYDIVRTSVGESDSFQIVDGDVVTIRSAAENADHVAVEGAVFGSPTPGDRPAQVPTTPLRFDLPYYPGMTVLSVLDSVGGPTPHAVESASYVVRATGTRVAVNVSELWKTRSADQDLNLAPGDKLIVPIERLQVFVTGMVVRPGAVPYTSGYSVYDYILNAGGFDPVRADKRALFLVAENGRRTRVKSTDILPNGSHITVGQKAIFAVDQQVQNALIAAAWITSIVTATTTVLDFVLTYIVPIFSPDTQQPGG